MSLKIFSIHSIKIMLLLKNIIEKIDFSSNQYWTQQQVRESLF